MRKSKQAPAGEPFSQRRALCLRTTFPEANGPDHTLGFPFFTLLQVRGDYGHIDTGGSSLTWCALQSSDFTLE